MFTGAAFGVAVRPEMDDLSGFGRRRRYGIGIRYKLRWTVALTNA